MNNRKYFDEQVADSDEFQDFVSYMLFLYAGLSYSCYKSPLWQIHLGESRLGLEIKYDKTAQSHIIAKQNYNLYIETEERYCDTDMYKASGIYRNDNSWLYTIGNYYIIYIFSKKLLGQIKSKYKNIEISRKTSKGFLLPRSDAEKYAAKIIHPKLSDMSPEVQNIYKNIINNLS